MQDKRVTRRSALRGLAAAPAAVLAGCPTPPVLPDSRADAGPLGDDARAPDAPASWDAGLPPTGPFRHGVASGDPWAHSVLLWTRISEAADRVQVEWEVATSPSFTDVRARGLTATDADRDFTLKVEATGLSAATTYYYRFRLGTLTSPIGRTRTAPDRSVERLRFAVCSCASFAHGYFHAYRRIAEREDLDAIVHLGDFIYEVGSGEYGDVRPYDPPHELITLDDYRRRYAHYHLDRDLQEALRQHPIIATWDDHESADNAYRMGARSHQPSEGSWADRRSAAGRAYLEWMPVRADIEGDRVRLFRALRYGELADLIVLDTRLWGRDAQATGPTDPTLASETRTLLGGDQAEWLFEQLAASTARWKVLCQQVMMAQLPFLLNPDQWDGYPRERQRLFEFVARDPRRSDVVVLTGDIHSSWVAELTSTPLDPDTYDPTTGRGSVAVEFVCPGVTSPGLGVALERAIRERLASDAPHIKYLDLARRGYLVLDLDGERAQAAWFYVDDVTTPTGGREALGAAYETASGSARASEASTVAPSRPGPPLAPDS